MARQVLTAEFQAFRGMLGMGVVLVVQAPEAKGLVERANGYLETTLPGPSCTVAGFSRQLGGWLKRADQGSMAPPVLGWCFPIQESV